MRLKKCTIQLKNTNNPIKTIRLKNTKQYELKIPTIRLKITINTTEKYQQYDLKIPSIRLKNTNNTT
jgi:predicted  nucleic acid-binding Zn-ribbon protein